jgi:hypothetical protein
MMIEKKLTWTVKSKLEREDGKVVINLVPTTPEGIEYSSPSEGIFVTAPVSECTLSVGDIIEGPTVAQYDDGVIIPQ